MTLEEAINHADEIGNQPCDECANEHKQLAFWLRELKWYREKSTELPALRVN